MHGEILSIGVFRDIYNCNTDWIFIPDYPLLSPDRAGWRLEQDNTSMDSGRTVPLETQPKEIHGEIKLLQNDNLVLSNELII